MTAAREDYAAATMGAGALILAVLMAPTLAAHAHDARTLIGVSVWDKPLKFELSIAIHLATLAILVGLMTPEGRASRTVRVAALAGTLASIGEIAYILLQAARGRASHFNNDTVFEVVMYAVMGGGAVTMVIAAFVIGLAILRRARPEIGPGLKLGAVLGLTGGAAATLVIAGLMSSQLVADGHWIGGVQSDAAGLPLFGWSTTGGDLRAPHFFATHLMQALPILGLLADALAKRHAAGVVWAGAALGALVVIGAFVQALLGRPLLTL